MYPIYYPVLWAEDVSEPVRKALKIDVKPSYFVWSESHWLTVTCGRSYVREVVFPREATKLTRSAMQLAGYVLIARRVFSWKHRYAGEIGTWMIPSEAIDAVQASKGSLRYVSNRQLQSSWDPISLEN
jgi:hypothetical protein